MVTSYAQEEPDAQKEQGGCSVPMACAGADLAKGALENPAPGTIATVAGLLLATENSVLTASGQRVPKLPLQYGMDIKSYNRAVTGAKYLNVTGNLLGYGSYGWSTINYAESMRTGDYAGARDAGITAFYGALMMAPPHVITIPVGLTGLYVTSPD